MNYWEMVVTIVILLLASFIQPHWSSTIECHAFLADEYVVPPVSTSCATWGYPNYTLVDCEGHCAWKQVGGATIVGNTCTVTGLTTGIRISINCCNLNSLQSLPLANSEYVANTYLLSCTNRLSSLSGTGQGDATHVDCDEDESEILLGCTGFAEYDTGGLLMGTCIGHDCNKLTGDDAPISDIFNTSDNSCVAVTRGGGYGVFASAKCCKFEIGSTSNNDNNDDNVVRMGCETVWGSISGTGDDETSIVGCKNNQFLANCAGIKPNTDAPEYDGVRILEGSTNQSLSSGYSSDNLVSKYCQAWNGAGSDSGIYSQALCCSYESIWDTNNNKDVIGIGKYVDYVDFIDFGGNISCKDTENAYAVYDQVSLTECLNQCKYDEFEDSNKTCRFAMFINSHKGSNDKKCLLFDRWCDFEYKHSFGGGLNEKQTVYFLDFGLIGFDSPSDWQDSYYDGCDDYNKHEWCIDGSINVANGLSFQSFNSLRDKNGYNLTAIDVCEQCSGGINQYNITNMSLNVVLPIHQDFDSLVTNNNDLKCYLDLEEIVNTNDDSSTSNSYNYLNAFDRISLYSACEQLVEKLAQFYDNKDNEELYMLTNQLDCDIFSLLDTSATITRTNFYICDYYNDDDDSVQGETLLDFIFGIGIDNKTSESLLSYYNYSVNYNVYLNTLWVDIDSIFIHLFRNENYYNLSFTKCNNAIYNETLYSFSVALLPCNIPKNISIDEYYSFVGEFVDANSSENPGGSGTSLKKKNTSRDWIWAVVVCCLLLVLSLGYYIYRRRKLRLMVEDVSRDSASGGGLGIHHNRGGVNVYHVGDGSDVPIKDNQHTIQRRGSTETLKLDGLCTVCQDDLKDVNKPLTVLKCKHVFHEQCWTEYKNSMGRNQSRSATCPNCRNSVYS